MSRLALKGRLAELHAERLDLAAEAGRLIHSLRDLALPLPVLPLTDMDTVGISAVASRLNQVRERFLGVTADIREIEKELG